MSYPNQSEITAHNVRNFDPNSLLEDGRSMKPEIAGSMKKYITGLVKSLPGNVLVDTANELVSAIAEYEAEAPLFSAQPFRYAPLPHLQEQGLERTAEATVRSAISNMWFMQQSFGVDTFAAQEEVPRTKRVVEWFAPIDYDYQLRARGASGASTFSIDLGLGVVDHTKKEQPKYKELWRTGIDVVDIDGSLGSRFIRTGSGVKPEDMFKRQAFDEFRKRHHILPQRLLGIIGLYFMRELRPSYAVALTTPGAINLSTLGHSKGCCDYTGIFSNVGFEPTADEHWLGISEFSEGFYEALKRADINRSEERTLDASLEALNGMSTVNPSQQHKSPLFKLCTDDSKEVIERELEVAFSRVR